MPQQITQKIRGDRGEDLPTIKFVFYGSSSNGGRLTMTGQSMAGIFLLRLVPIFLKNTLEMLQLTDTFVC